MHYKYLSNHKYKHNEKEDICIFAKPSIFEEIQNVAFDQLESIYEIPNVEKIIGLPDIQPGYGVPIGSCFASKSKHGFISCEAVGYDINCGIRLIKTNLTKKDLTRKQLHEIADAFKQLPIGLSKSGININLESLNSILEDGINWAINSNYAKAKDKHKIDSKGHYKKAQPKCVSRLAKQRGIEQVGTLGKGNHFIDLVLVSKIFNKSACEKYNLKKNQYCILLHTGSRGLGHQIARDYFNLFKHKYPISHHLFYSDIGQSYFSAMKCAANYAFVNRAVLTTLVEEKLTNTLDISKRKLGFDLIYDICHNFADLEKYNGKEYIVHRKGAARITSKKKLSKSSPYKSLGNPIILPGSMLAPSFVLKPKSNTKSFLDTIPHGSGRKLSRNEAKSKIKIQSLKVKMSKNKVVLAGKSENLLREEQPRAYKDPKDIVKTIEKMGAGSKVCQLDPKVVIFG